MTGPTRLGIYAVGGLSLFALFLVAMCVLPTNPKGMLTTVQVMFLISALGSVVPWCAGFGIMLNMGVFD